MIAEPPTEARLLHDTLCRLREGGRQPTLQARLAVALLRRLADDPAATPNVAQLARQLGVHRSTLHQALAALRRKGWLTSETTLTRRVVVERRTVWRVARRVA